MSDFSLSPVNRTALWTLAARATEQTQPQPILLDTTAAAWHSQLAEQTDLLADVANPPVVQLNTVIRSALLDQLVKKYRQQQPNIQVIELGAGLSTRRQRLGVTVENWLLVDMPAMLELRATLSEEDERVIAASVTADGWQQHLTAPSDAPLLFVAEGLLMYLQPAQARKLIEQLTVHAPGAPFLFDILGARGVHSSAFIFERAGVQAQTYYAFPADIPDLGVDVVRLHMPLLAFKGRQLAVQATPITQEEAPLIAQVVDAHLRQQPPQPPPDKVNAPAIDIPNNYPTPGTPGICYYDQLHTTDKTFTHGTHRARTPAETLEYIRPNFSWAGITRVADITHLDRIGIPVTLVIRPNGRVLSNSTGKGVTLTAATVSGVMESIEAFHAEMLPVPTTVATYDQITTTYPSVSPLALQRTRDNIYTPRMALHWLKAWDLINDVETMVPADAMLLQYLEPMHMILVSSNGLSSGNTFLEAVAAGLHEVIERDATTAFQARWNLLGVPPSRVRLGAIESALLQELIGQCQQAEIEVMLFDSTSDIGVPTYIAIMYDRRDRSGVVASGYGAHLDPEVAASRAITEAAQGRAVVIAGSRDEFFKRRQLTDQSGPNRRALIEQVSAVPETEDMRVQNLATGSFEGDIKLLLARLQAVGIEQVLVRDLTAPNLPISVVSVVVPGLDGYLFESGTLGRRAQRFLRSASTLCAP